MKVLIKKFLIFSIFNAIMIGYTGKINAYGGITESMFDNAARKGSTILLRCLLFLGANQNIKNRALAVALANKQKKVANLMLNKGADINGEHLGKKPIHFAVSNPEMTEFALEHGADAKAKDVNGMTPLMWWTKGDNPTESAELLLKKGAGTFAQDLKGSTALFHAIFEGNNTAVDFLLNHGANPKTEDKQGFNALMAAAIFGNAETLRLLLKKNVPVNDTNLNGETPFMLAIFSGKLENARILYDEGKANIRATTLQGHDALCLATLTGNIPAIQLCVELGLDPFKANRSSISAYDIAKRSGNDEIRNFFDNMK